MNIRGTFEIKKGSTDRSIQPVLSDDSTTDDLSTAQSAKLYARHKKATTNRIDGLDAATLTASLEEIKPRFDLSLAHVRIPGEYLMYYVVTYSSGRKGRFPSGNDFDLLVIGESFE